MPRARLKRTINEKKNHLFATAERICAKPARASLQTAGQQPLQALIICSTISAAPRLWRRDCWYRSRCFSISFSCESRGGGRPLKPCLGEVHCPPQLYTHTHTSTSLVIELFTSSNLPLWQTFLHRAQHKLHTLA